MKPVRLVVMLLRPPVAAVVLLFAAIGAASAGAADDLHPLFTSVLLMVGSWFVNAAALNDLADEAIDRVNLPAAHGRPLVSGAVSRRGLVVLGLGAGAVALAVAAFEGGPVVLVVAAGLALNAAYSLRPFRLSDRGTLATLVLPAGYVAVPYLIGALAVRPSVGAAELALLPGLYVAFMGRIVLKDFRDTAGDALYGKWTFLLRHGRHATCLLSGACWVVGAVAVLSALPERGALAVPVTAMLACALHGLARLDGTVDRFEEQVVIGGIAMAGRGLCIAVLAHLTMLQESWSATSHAAILTALAATFVVAATHRAEQRALAPARPW